MIKSKIRSTLLFVFALSFFATLNAQTNNFVGNNYLLTPPGLPTAPDKFCAIGESGGVPGAINGCDLYGFTSRLPAGFLGGVSGFVNLGLEPIQIFNNYAGANPVLSWRKAIYDLPQDPAFNSSFYFKFDDSDLNCGQIVMELKGASTTVLRVFGDATINGTFISSDRRYKRNIETVTNPMAIISQLRGTRYEYNVSEFSEKNFREGPTYGFIAQEIEEVMPEAVLTNEEGYKAVNYDMVVPVLVEAVKTQQEALDAKDAQINDLSSRLARLEAMMLNNNSKLGDAATGMNEFSNRLEQNSPNPFNEITRIKYEISADASNAILRIYDLRGTLMTEFNNLERGKGSIEVNGNTLEAGVYLYTLIVDGLEVETKRMVLTK